MKNKINILYFITVIACQFVFSKIELTAQNNPPAIEYSSMMNIRYYPQSGGFLLEGLQIVFPPNDEQTFELAVHSKDGNKAAGLPLRLERWPDFPAFGILKPNGVPGNIKIEKAGIYKLSVIYGGKEITELNFELKAAGGDDPYDPQKIYSRVGDWSSLGYLSNEFKDTEKPITFNFWMSASELPEGNKKALCTLHLIKNDIEIAGSNSAFVVSNDDWVQYRVDLFSPKAAGGNKFTRNTLEKEDGDYRIDIKANTVLIKSFTVKIRNGKIEESKRSRQEYQPNNDFLSPRLIDTSSGSTSRYKMLEVFWLVANIN